MNTDHVQYLITREKGFAERARAAMNSECEALKHKTELRSHHLVHLENAMRELRHSLLKIEALSELKP